MFVCPVQITRKPCKTPMGGGITINGDHATTSNNDMLGTISF
jgi:hypothetical protein